MTDFFNDVLDLDMGTNGRGFTAPNGGLQACIAKALQIMHLTNNHKWVTFKFNDKRVFVHINDVADDLANKIIPQ